ncbi:MAG TPA: DUF1588 domain-containing protein [Polyangiaceae bacterium]|nr:DUF1588 domain-containing protein [Polyangiaceae bacterium]
MKPRIGSERLGALCVALPLIGAAWACSGEAGTGATSRSSSDGTNGTNGSTNSSGTTTTGSGGGSSDGTTGSGTTGSSTGSGGTGPVSFNLDCDAPAVGSPTLRLLTRQEMVNTLNSVFPSVAGQWQSTLPANQVSAAGFDNAASSQVGNQYAELLLETAEAVGDAVTASSALGNLLPCSTSSPDRSCAEQYVTDYGQRLFRRPLTQEETERYLTYFDGALEATDFATAIKWVTVGLVQSPSAVYRSEIGSDMGDGTRKLSAYELATELAYTYTGAPPSDDLLSSAAGGDLGDLTALAQGMLATEAGKQTVQRFFEGYLAYTRVASTQKPNVQGFDTAKLDMLEETRAFIDSVVFQSGAGVRELLTSQNTNPSTALASFYGFPAPPSDYASVQRPAGQGVGILAQGAFLASHSNADASSPTKRGLFAFMNLLCQPKPELPANVPELSAAEPGVKTTRQRYEEVHAGTGVCKNCHANFDPIGFGFEHFDEAGRYREQEQGLTIDASGQVLDAEGTELFAFDGQEQLMTNLADQSIVYQCFSAYLATYAFGTTQSCLGPTRAADLEAGTVGVAEAFAALTAEPHFTTRSAQ